MNQRALSLPDFSARGPTAASWIPRHALGWLLAAQLALIAPHVQRLPIWIALAWLICACWRVRVFQGRWSLPRGPVKALAGAAGFAGIYFSYGNWFGLEPTVALLIAGFSFKLAEASRRRDAYLLLFLGYFVALTEFLFEQGVGIVLYMLLPLLLLTTALLALQQREPLRFSLRPLRAASALSAQALPLMLLLFLVFPRLAPLWQVPLPGAGGATTGISDRLAPGDIAQLSQSDALAFRAHFAAAPPPRADLYWRALVFEVFDGRAWQAAAGGDRPLRASAGDDLPGPVLDYEVYLEPTRQRWLFALQRPLPADAKTLLTADYRLLAPDAVYEKFLYRVRSYPAALQEVELSEARRRFNLRLPANNNPRSREWALRLRAESVSDGEFIARVLAEFRRQSFVYTLKPPPLGANGIDAFLFGTRRGFCEHYAASFAFLMRAAGVPARVVVGYQGGEINPRNGTVLLHQFDAHAWVEVWLPGRGWLRIDPTAAVAPERIEKGLDSAVDAAEFLEQTPFSAQRYRRLGWLNDLRLRLDAVNYWWTRWVLNYRGDTQGEVLQTLLGDINSLRVGMLLLGGGALALGLLALVLLARDGAPRRPPEQRLYRRFCRRLARRGYPRPAGMAPRDYARWVLAQQPRWRAVAEVTDVFEALSYRPLQPAQRRLLLKTMARALQAV